MITNAQLARMRVVDESTMVDRADIVSKTRVSDSAGGFIVAQTIQSNVPCRRAPNLAGNVETQLGGQLTSGLQWKFSFPYGTIITGDDEIVQGSEVFAVMGILGPRTYETARQIICVEKSAD